MKFKLDVSGEEAISKKLNSNLYLPTVQGLLKDSSAIAAREANEGARGDINTITLSARARSPLQIAVSSANPGALAAEFGRHAGTPAPPLAVLRAWAARHGMAGREFVLARAIRRRGIKGRFFLRHARERLERVDLPRLLRSAASEIERKWSS